MEGIFPLLVLLLAAAAHADRVSFRGYHLLEATPNSEVNVEWLRSLEVASDTETIDFWQPPTKPDENCTMAVHPDLLDELEDVFEKVNISHTVMAADLQALIDQETDEIFKDDDDEGLKYRDPSRSYYDDSNYNRLSKINLHLQELQTQYSGQVSIRSIGTTAEGRTIDLVHLSLGGNKPAMWVDCGIHAREWVSPAFCVHLIKTALSEGEAGMLRHIDLHVVPVANPDGYEYTWQGNRMWRKNRRSVARFRSSLLNDKEVDTKQFWPGFGSIIPQLGQQPQYPAVGAGVGAGFGAVGTGGGFASGGGFGNGKNCVGVDPNRNFDIDFGVTGSSGDCSRDTYHGPAAFSEAESMAIKQAVASIQSQQKLVSFISVHAYSQLWMTPYGYSKIRSHDYKDLMRVAKAATDALRSVYGTSFRYGPINEVIYQASGSSVDWAYVKADIKYSYALELRDTGNYGFLLPAHLIQPTVIETYNGFTAMVSELAKEFN